MEGGRLRGGSTLTQQLVKNLFFGTGRLVLRKGVEFTLVPVAEFVLGKGLPKMETCSFATSVHAHDTILA
jgi:hypothetical protein